jgi:hypothetical protein
MANASMYMPIRTVLESLGYTVSADSENRAVLLTKDEPAAKSGAVTGQPEVYEPETFLNDENAPFSPEGIQLVKLTDADGNPAYFVKPKGLLDIVSTQDKYYQFQYNEAENTFIVTSNPPVTDSIHFWDALTNEGANLVDGTINWWGEGLFVDFEKDGKTVSLHFLTDVTPSDFGTAECGGKITEFECYTSGGGTYVSEKTFIKALKDVGFLN